MNWHLTDKEIAKMQEEDEKHFYDFFSEMDYCPVKLDVGNKISSPDYSLTKNGIMLICEIKSRFGNQIYEIIYSEFVMRINALPFGYDYAFQHLYEKMPSQSEFNIVLQQIEKKLAKLPHSITFPYNLSQLLWQYDIPGNLPEIEKTFFTLWRKNTDGKMSCDYLSRGYHGYPGERDKSYFKKILNDVKLQLNKHIEYDEIVGVVFFDHTGFGWEDTDIMSLYGDLDFQYRQGPKGDTWLITSGKNKIVGMDKKTWLSYLGVWEYIGGRPILNIYRNGFAKNELPKDYFPKAECKTYTISLDEQGNLITDIPSMQ